LHSDFQICAAISRSAFRFPNLRARLQICTHIYAWSREIHTKPELIRAIQKKLAAYFLWSSAADQLGLVQLGRIFLARYH
jgi:hypothetical protein